MQSSKKFLITLLCILLFVSSLSACGNTTPAERITVSGKENVLPLENNFALEASEYLETITSNFPGGAPKNKLREWIVNELKNVGYSNDQIELQGFRKYVVFSGKNIVLTVPGKNTDKQIIVGAHYDGSGAGDNASGVALVLAQAVGLADKQLPYTVKYIFFDLEEKGLLGSEYYVNKMSDEEKASTLFMVNIDCVAFGDYAFIYGGNNSEFDFEKIINTQAYELAMKHAEALGFNTYKTEDLDGYYKEHGCGPDADPMGVFSNPWTAENPPSEYFSEFSPMAAWGSDHSYFSNNNIPYICFEATNWFASGKELNELSFSGYYETTNTDIGQEGMFMNTEYDTMENLELYFPGRVMEHYNIYSPLLSKLLLEPEE